MACSNDILIVNSTIVCSNYLQQQAARILAEVDAKFDMFMEEKQQVIGYVAKTKTNKKLTKGLH